MLLALAIALHVCKPQGQATFADLDRLVAIYRECDLPIPAPEASIVRVLNYTVATPDMTTCGYRQGTTATGKVRVLVGPWTFPFDPTDQAPFTPTMADVPRLDFGGNTDCFGTFDEDNQLAFAVIERTRRHDDFALALLQQAVQRPFRIKLFTAPKAEGLEGRMWALALQRVAVMAALENSDRALALRRIDFVLKRHPSLKSLEALQLQRGLKATVEQRYRGKNKVGKDIDSLCDVEAHSHDFPFTEDSNIIAKPLENLISAGYSAVPKLLEHLEDPRIMRGVHFAGPGRPSSFVTLGMVCSEIVRGLSGRLDLSAPYSRGFPNMGGQNEHPGQDAAQVAANSRAFRSWWATASHRTDHQNFLAAVRSSGGAPSRILVRWAQIHEPDALLKAYLRILAGKDDVSLREFQDGLVRSTLQKAKILDAVEKGTYSSNYRQVGESLECLNRISREHFVKRYLSLVKQIGPSWDVINDSGLPTEVTNAATLTSDPRVWDALLVTTRNAGVRMRREILQSLHIWQEDAAIKRRLLVFFVSFFDDRAVDQTGDIPTSERRLRIQDVAAMNAAQFVGIIVPLEVADSQSELDTFRQMVMRAIQAELGAK